MALILGIYASSQQASKITAFASIATVTAAGGESTLSFTSIPSTFKHLQIRGIGRRTTGVGTNTGGITIQFNGDTATNYAYHNLSGTASGSATAVGVITYAYMMAQGGTALNGNAAGTFGTSIIDIADYASTTKNKTIRSMSGTDVNAASASIGISLNSGLWLSTAAITSIAVGQDSGSFAAGSTFALYGIKG